MRPVHAMLCRALDIHKSGIEDATIFIGFLAFILNLSCEIVPLAELFAMLPTLRENGYRHAIHKACDTFRHIEGSLLCNIFQLLAVRHSFFHDIRPAFGKVEAFQAVWIAILFCFPIIIFRLVIRLHDTFLSPDFLVQGSGITGRGITRLPGGLPSPFHRIRDKERLH